MNVNSQYFDKEQVKSGALTDLIELLMKEAYSGSNYYNDIHVYPSDCGAFVVEWVQIPWNHDFGGSFQYVDEDERVMVERQYPDGTYGMFDSEEEYQEELKSWLEEHPQWKKNDYGMWYDADEQERWKKQIEKEKSEISKVSVEESVLTGLDENGTPQ